MKKIIATVNPITRTATVVINDKECETTHQLTFEDLDSWNSFEHNGQVYDVHFHYDEQMWFHIYEKENYKKLVLFELNYIYSDIAIITVQQL